jgi:hypothetical protein
VTPETLIRTFEQLTSSAEEKRGLIAELRAALDKIEREVKAEEEGKSRKAITYSTWSPVIRSKGVWMIYDYRVGFHKEPTDSVSMAMEMMKTMGAVEFFQKGTLTVDGIKSVAPVLLEMVGNDKLIKKLLSEHGSHMRDRARKNALEQTAPYILEIIKQKGPGEEAVIFNDTLAGLFFKHLNSSIDIGYLFMDPKGSVAVWAKASFMHFVRLLLEGKETTFSYTKWVEGALAEGLVQPDLDKIPLEGRFGRKNRLYRTIKRKLQSKRAGPDDSHSLEWVDDQPSQFVRDSTLDTTTDGSLNPSNGESLNHMDVKARTAILRGGRGVEAESPEDQNGTREAWKEKKQRI